MENFDRMLEKLNNIKKIMTDERVTLVRAGNLQPDEIFVRPWEAVLRKVTSPDSLDINLDVVYGISPCGVIKTINKDSLVISFRNA